ncbi:hypothetical protein [Notoacmeibacter ruber]|uniref:Phage tail protein n=1 Tax=Notoacmeibacter ruber TaxID=2670375 RepID=A0A3L7JF26_9HYPH|nr:hypothetical protein [Notoacmeibacter ruber]RLQ88929.1 hypothetical protein D8780_12510 [Notoacmeibacter ruber]
MRTPEIVITGPDGRNLAERLADLFIGVRISDLAMGEADELQIRFRRQRPYLQPPAADTEFRAAIGWKGGPLSEFGTFRYQRTLYTGEPESGQEMVLVCRAVEMSDGWKGVDSEHFDEENGHRTYGDVLRTLARREGLPAAIDPAIDALELPGGYLLRWRQSAVGLASEIGEDLGAIVKLQAGKLTVRRRGTSQTPSGSSLPPIVIPFDPNRSFQVDIEPRYGVASVAGGWFDASAGRPKEALAQLGRGSARIGLPHLFGSEQLAAAVAGAAAARMEAETAKAIFEMEGDARAVADAPVRPQGFGPDIDNINWIALACYHEAGPEAGWSTIVEAEMGWF